MRYEGQLFRPPSEARSLILQATIGCSHNLCTFCAMYRDKTYRVRDLESCVEDLRDAATTYGANIEKLFVADGDALAMPTEQWLSLLSEARSCFPRLRQVSCYATARNILEKDDDALARLQDAGLSLLYMGPESGDPETLKMLVKGATASEHVEAAQRARATGMRVSAILLLGAGGTARSREHAEASARLVTEMDPDYLSALTITVVPGTPLERLQERGDYEVPDVHALLGELRIIVDGARPTDALFRTNHASNYLPLGGRLPMDRERIVAVIDAALAGDVRLRPEWSRGL